ncbi:MAG: SDR family NAD(P)-dependent oxidoreductase, partial [Streptosporangiaceae bacterium]
MGKLDGRVAVITSGSTGIGRGIGEAFLAEGASIVINGRDPEKGAKALKEMNAGDRGHFIRGDVTIREDIDGVVSGAVERFGKIDILVNNAGGLVKTAPVANLADEDWDYAVKWNLYSAFWASRKALEYMIPQEFGRIIMI